MKKSSALFLIAALPALLAFGEPGKDKSFEGKLTYEITYEEVPEMLEPYIAMLPKENITYVKGSMTRSETSTMGQSTIFIFNSDTKKGFILMDGMVAQKTAFELNADEKEEQKASIPTVIKTKETKTISGYECRKVHMVFQETPSDTLDAYVTDQIKGKDFKMKYLDGFPMQYTMKNNGMVMQYTVTKVEPQKLSEVLFKVPDDYTVKPYSELEKMGKAGAEELEEDE